MDTTYLNQFYETVNKAFIISMTDINGIITYVNENFEKISGYSKNELIGKPHSIIRHPDTSKKVFEDMWDTILNGKIWTGVIKNRRKDLKPYYVYTVIAPIKENGKIVSFLSIRQDVTKLIETRKKLSEEKTLFVNTLNNTNNLILIRKNKKPFSANKLFLNFLGVKNINEFVKKYKNVKNIFLKDKECENLKEANFEDKKFFNKPIHVSIKDIKGEKKHFLLFIKSFTLQKNLYTILTFNDITEIEKARQKALESEQIKSRFLANISHELRTPLTSIMGYTDLLEQTHLSIKQKQYLNYIKESSKNMLNLLNTVLDFSKLESGKLELNPTPNNLYITATKVINTLKPLAEKKNLLLKLQIKTFDECFVYDELRLTQILTNLINNAIKFTEKGKVELIIEKDLTFRVIDTGKGIKKEKIKDIFKAYIQSEKTDQYQGTGLGLPITKKFVEMMGGELKIKSEVNKGSEFYFKLPLNRCDEKRLKEKIDAVYTTDKEIKEFLEKFEIETQKGKIKISSTPPADITVDKNDPNYLYSLYERLYNYNNDNIKQNIQQNVFKNEKVLIAEDNEFNILLFKEILQKLGLKPDIAKNGKEAVKKALQNDYRLILMDVNMPKLGGIEAAKQIKEKKQIPIIAITAHILPEETKKVLSVMDDLLSKPVNIEALKEKIKRFISTTEENLTANIAKKFDFSHEEAKYLIKVFLSNAKKYINELEKAIKNRNKEEIYKTLHNLKGSSGYFDINGIFELSKKHLELIKKDILPDISIINKLKRLVKELEEKT